ncbi:thiopurine S-methyltransferase isoform X2 [Rhineura floridana]|uniref:thiopurine S-methyltransferase isoform X2 n=1 Tax=Rhineura floridana TaxID=261503 RepID=UPI002AC86827|nr:thiopurine S-methyltransferase isoform X2 [Rhineura floridana]
MENPSDTFGKDDCGDAKSQEDRVLSEVEWLEKWQTRNIGFHNEQVHPLLRKYLDNFLNGRSRLKILFPLCGKAIEMKWLADMGHQVVGVEISESALKEFFAEQKLSFSEETVPEIPAKLLKSTTGNISLYCCNIYDLTSTITGKFDGIWDRGSLVAVNPCDRERYAHSMLSLMNSGCHCLLVTCLYDPSKHKGKFCEITFLEKVDALLERHKKWGLDYLCEMLYLIVLK